MAQTVKHLLAMRKTLVQSLGRENPLEKEMATHSSIPAWKIPWTEEPGMATLHGTLAKEFVRQDLATKQQQLSLLIYSTLLSL